MNANEYEYRKVIGAIGSTLLIFLLLINLYGVMDLLIGIGLEWLPVSEVVKDVIYQLFGAFGYLFSFLIPAWTLKCFLKGSGCRNEAMSLSLGVSAELPWMIFAGMAISFAAAQINTWLVSAFQYSEFSSEFLWADTSSMEPYELVLQFVSICVVPAFCEELLFRGAILSNCRRFGRANAVFISALLFSLMHQNIEQIFYTFVAGLILGVIYERTGSIWNCVALHLVNNFVSLIQSALIANLPDTYQANLAALLLECGVYCLGILSVAILLKRHFSQDKSFRNGIFGVECEASDAYATSPISSHAAVKYFFRPTMVAFLVICILQILFLIAFAIWNAKGM